MPQRGRCRRGSAESRASLDASGVSEFLQAPSNLGFRAMSSIVDSEAQFNKRVLALGLSQAFLDAVRAAGVRTLSQLLFGREHPLVRRADGRDGAEKGAARRADY